MIPSANFSSRAGGGWKVVYLTDMSRRQLVISMGEALVKNSR